MTNDEFSQLAAKAAGVTIGSNGKPAFTSYEQSMKYAEALTNLHKSGIDRNSTPQEIAAASVGTTINKNGAPNISSISQGQSYGSALKNITSNPQPNVNQNSSGANSNTSSSRNNTNNNANPNTTSSTRSASSTNSTSSSNRLSNADFNRLAAQIVGVPTDANGNPVCNSYEQYMQFGQTLANLHNGGINKNSTPQEIAAASVGTTLNENGRPNISSVPQGQSYGKALKNIQSGTQQEVSYVNQNPSGSNPNTTSSRNNTNNNANTNTISSTSSSNKFTNEEYIQMAAQITGVYADSNGKTIFISYEQSMIYAQVLTNLHNGGINRNSTPQEIAAASAGIKLDKNGNPVFSNDTQRQNYNRALNLTCQIAEDVSSGASVQSNGEKVYGGNSYSTDSTSLSTIYLGKHSEGFENYLRGLEKTYGTQYMFEVVFKGDGNKYDPYKRASELSNVPLDRGGQPINYGLESKKAFEAALYGTKNNSSNNTYVSPKKTEVSSGMKYTTKDILNLNGSTVFVVNDGKIEMGENVTVNIDEELAEIIMATSNEFNIDPTLIIAVMAHESRFDSEVSSGFASGLMQVSDKFFPTYASENKELIESLGGDYTNIYDEAANIVAWGASYSIWVDTYGDNKNSLKALRQGCIQPDNYPDGWSPNATNNANEFMDIKNELDNMIK